MRKRLLLAAVVLAAALAGCGGDPEGDGVASAGNAAAASPSASAAAAGDESEQMLKFTECMRGEGVQMDDPEPGGGFRFRAGAGSDQAKVEAAMEKCRQYMPNGGEQQRMAPEDIEKARQYSKCMRDNGVPAFPDPDPETGGIMLRGAPGTGLDPESAEFKAAQKTCESLQPRRAGGNG